MVHPVWREAGLKPHRLESHMASDDPDFERNAAALYLIGGRDQPLRQICRPGVSLSGPRGYHDAPEGFVKWMQARRPRAGI
jgi:hypothetical protein